MKGFKRVAAAAALAPSAAAQRETLHHCCYEWEERTDGKRERWSEMEASAAAAVTLLFSWHDSFNISNFIRQSQWVDYFHILVFLTITMPTYLALPYLDMPRCEGFKVLSLMNQPIAIMEAFITWMTYDKRPKRNSQFDTQMTYHKRPKRNSHWLPRQRHSERWLTDYCNNETRRTPQQDDPARLANRKFTTVPHNLTIPSSTEYGLWIWSAI